MERKYLPTLSELIDRLSIAQLKEVFIPEHKEEYAQEIADICHDIEIMLPESSEFIRSIVVLSQMNLHIWHNESNYRKGIKDGNNLELHTESMELEIQQKIKSKRLLAAEKIIKSIVWL